MCEITSTIETQCCAPAHNNHRCKNDIYKSFHCKDHFPTANKLYTKYKQICDVAYELDPKIGGNIQNKIKHAMKCYVWQNRAYNARMEHRKYAFVPECYNKGHDYQFTMLKDRIKETEQLLIKLYNDYIKSNQMNKTDNINKILKSNPYYHINETIDKCESISGSGSGISEIEDGINDIEFDISSKNSSDTISEQDFKNIPKKIKKYGKNRKQIAHEANMLIDKYIKENKKIFNKFAILNGLIKNKLTSIFGKMDPIMAHQLTILSHNIIANIYNLGYFEDDYVPEKCVECACNGYISNDISIVCNCLERTTDVDSFLNDNDREDLKDFYEILVRHEAKYKPIFLDFYNIYTLYGSQIIYNVIFSVCWDDKLKRLVLSAYPLKKKKIYKMKSLNRLNKHQALKYLEYHNMYEDSDDDYSDSSDFDTDIHPSDN